MTPVMLKLALRHYFLEGSVRRVFLYNWWAPVNSRFLVGRHCSWHFSISFATVHRLRRHALQQWSLIVNDVCRLLLFWGFRTWGQVIILTHLTVYHIMHILGYRFLVPCLFVHCQRTRCRNSSQLFLVPRALCLCMLYHG